MSTEVKKALSVAMGHVEHMAKFIGTLKTGYSFESLSEDMPDIVDAVNNTPNDFVWINKPATVRGEDFSYEATVLCSFPKTSGKVRYVVEDHGRIFIQRGTQITFIAKESGPESLRDMDEFSGSIAGKVAGPDPKLLELEKALASWMGEVDMVSGEKCPDGTPRMGKFETEEVYRKAQEYFKAKAPTPAAAPGGCPHCGYRHPPDGVCV